MYNRWKLQQFFCIFCNFFPHFFFFLNDLSINSHFPEEKWKCKREEKRKSRAKRSVGMDLKKEEKKKSTRWGGGETVNGLYSAVECLSARVSMCAVVCACKCYVERWCCSVREWLRLHLLLQNNFIIWSVEVQMLFCSGEGLAHLH